MRPSARSQSAGSPSALSGLVANAKRGCEPEPAVRLAHLAEQRLDLVGQLVRADVDVGVVLDELAHAGQAATACPERSLRWSRPYSLRRSGRSR